MKDENKNINHDVLKDIEDKCLVTNYDISKSDDVSCLQIVTIGKDDVQVLCELYNKDADIVNYLINDYKKRIIILQRRLNDVVFNEANNDVELAARYLRKIGYVGFNEDSKTYINLHNDEPFWDEDEREKDYYIKDEELDEYTKQLEHTLNTIKSLVNKYDVDYLAEIGEHNFIEFLDALSNMIKED